MTKTEEEDLGSGSDSSVSEDGLDFDPSEDEEAPKALDWQLSDFISTLDVTSKKRKAAEDRASNHGLVASNLSRCCLSLIFLRISTAWEWSQCCFCISQLELLQDFVQVVALINGDTSSACDTHAQKLLNIPKILAFPFSHNLVPSQHMKIPASKFRHVKPQSFMELDSSFHQASPAHLRL